MKVLGIDEAGRGALIGPLVIGGFLIDDEFEEKLIEMGVKDSKQLTPKKREEIYNQLIKLGKHKTIKISPMEIDMRSKIGNLNTLEISKMIKIIKEFKPDLVIIDSPSRNEEKVMNKIVEETGCEAIIKCKADALYKVVGAASIIAKHERDLEIKKIENEINEKIGSGYPSDPTTIKFAKQAIQKSKYRKYIRKSWITIENLSQKLLI